VIYISSMRSLTHPNTFYGNLKKRAEVELFRKATILRLGTVHGGLDPHMYNRTITVPNNYAVRGEAPDANWKAFITPMKDVIIGVVSAIGLAAPIVENLHSPDYPCLASDLEFETEPTRVKYAREEHPAYATARYYDLPLPKEEA
jgi:hypothetical protein